MAEQAGLIVQGDEENNNLAVKVVHEENGDVSIYNVVEAGDGADLLVGRVAGEEDQQIIDAYGVQLFGEGGKDRLVDSSGNDTLSGGTEDDYIISAAGADTIDGGDGVDTLDLDRYDTIDANSLSITGIERLLVAGTLKVGDLDLSQFSLLGTSGRATLVLTNETSLSGLLLADKSDWTIEGSDFDDVLDFSASTTAVTVMGGRGNDTIAGTSAVNMLDGGAGNDTLTGGGKNDVITGGAGNDMLIGNGGKDSLTDTSGNDTVIGGDNDDHITLRGGNDTVFAKGGDDTILLSTGAFSIDAGDGDDNISLDGKAVTGLVLDGGAGDDTLHAVADMSGFSVEGVETLTIWNPKITIDADVLNGFDKIELQQNSTSLKIDFFAGGTFEIRDRQQLVTTYIALTGSDEKDVIDTGASTATWTIKGGGGDDVITGKDRGLLDGGEGNDTLSSSGAELIGGDGNDRLTSLAKTDGAMQITMSGGNGNDIMAAKFMEGEMHGGDGNDKLNATSTSGALYGDAGNDKLTVKLGDGAEMHGGSGNDVLTIGAGYDNSLWGDAGKDAFAFTSSAYGTTILQDFDHSGKDHDRIDLSAIKSISGFDDLVSHHVTDEFGNSSIHFGKYAIEIYGLDVKDLDESLFVF